METIEKSKIKPHYAGHRERLRERFLKNGAAALQDYELLELILFAASPRQDVKPLAKELINTFGSFGSVLHAPQEELLQVYGVNISAVTAIKAVKASCELLLREEVKDKPVIKGWTALLDYCRVHMGRLKHEEFHVLFLNNKLAVIADEMQQRGTVDHTPIYPREVMKRALDLGATAIILVHNHPSGECSPSKEDIELTKQVIASGESLGIIVHDHLIVTAKDSFSFKAHGLI